MLDGSNPRWADIQAMAQLAEDVGFDSLWFPDHLLFRMPAADYGAWECWSLLAAVAAVTRRIALGPFVSCLGFRNPALLAKMADTVDEISGGRLILGLGAGWHEPEYRAFGYPFDHRASRFEEGIQIIHALLREGRVDFAGDYYQARECELRPRGPRQQGPPILIGTRGHRMLRLAARYADSWNTDWVLPADLPPQQAAVDAACDEVGRDPLTLERTASVHIDLPGVERRPFGSTRQRTSGSPEELAAFLRGFGDAGIAHVQIWLAPNTAAGIEAFAPVLEYLKRD
jgi:probable F420-dependent oxidoreductase